MQRPLTQETQETPSVESAPQFPLSETPIETAQTALQKRQQEREELLHRVQEMLQADSHIVAAWLFGSLGREDADELSDLDVWVVVEDAHCAETVQQRHAFVSRAQSPLLLLDAPQNAPPHGGYLLTLYPGETGPLQVDWYWQPRSEAFLPQETRLLFDNVGLPSSDLPPLTMQPEAQTLAERNAQAAQKATFFLAMAPIVAKYIARRDAWTVMTMTRMIADTLEDIRRLLEAHPASHNRVSVPVPPTEPAAQLATLREMTQELEGLRPQITAGGANTPNAVPEIVRFYDFVETLLNLSGEKRR